MSKAPKEEAQKPSYNRYKFEVLLNGKDVGEAVDVENDEVKAEIINSLLERDYNITNVSIVSNNCISFTICSTPDKKFSSYDLFKINQELKEHSYAIRFQLTHDTTIFIKTRENFEKKPLLNKIKEIFDYSIRDLRLLYSQKGYWAIFVEPGKVETLLPKLKGVDFIEYAADCNTRKYEASVFVQTIEEAPEGSSPVKTDIGYRLTYKRQKDIKEDFKNIRKNEKIKIGVPINTYYRAINAVQAQIGCKREQIIVDDYFFVKPVTLSLISTEIAEDESVASRIPISNKLKNNMIRKLKSYHISGDLLELAIVYAEDLDDIETLVNEPDFVSKILDDITETDKCMELLEYVSVTQGKGWEAACDEIYSNFCS